MSMTASSSSSNNDTDSRSLQVLLEAFGSRFSLDDITNAYCQASQNVDVAGEILFGMTQTDQVNVPKAKVWRPKKSSVSNGTVSSVIGKEYARTVRNVGNVNREGTKPVKIDSKDIPESEIWSEEIIPRSSNEVVYTNRDPTEREEFIEKMLREGFQASQEVIHQILGVCGYDVKKSTERLLDLSNPNKYADVGVSNGTGSVARNEVELPEISHSDGGREVKTSLEKEVLEALFSGVQRYEEKKPKVISRKIGERRARVAGRPVYKPLEDPFQERVVVMKKPVDTSKQDEEDENEYKAHRKAAHEYRLEMNQYYLAAVEAFSKGDTERARRLGEKGHFCGRKALEADDKSTAKILLVKKDGDSTYEEDEVLDVNVSEHEPREALRPIKIQLKNFSGIPSCKYLRVKLGDNKEDPKCKRKRTVIAKLLEGESIAWSEEDDGLIMMIRIDEIDPKKLSFAKK